MKLPKIPLQFQHVNRRLLLAMSDIVEGYMYQHTKDVITRVTKAFSKPDHETQIVMIVKPMI